MSAAVTNWLEVAAVLGWAWEPADNAFIRSRGVSYDAEPTAQAACAADGIDTPEAARLILAGQNFHGYPGQPSARQS